MRQVTLPRCPRPSWAAAIYAVSRSRFARIRPAKVDPGIRFNEPGMQRRRGRVSPGVQDGLGLELLALDKSTVATSASVFGLMWSASRVTGELAGLDEGKIYGPVVGPRTSP
jgi:hypothetical protein